MTSKEGCIFCAIAARSAPAEVVEADDVALAFLDISPATRGHTLVIPRNHSENLLEISAEDLQHVATMAQSVARRMPAALGCDGVNLLNSCGPVAWQTVFHFHMHVVPRHAGDGIALSWPRKEPPAEVLQGYAERLRAALA